MIDALVQQGVRQVPSAYVDMHVWRSLALDSRSPKIAAVAGYWTVVPGPDTTQPVITVHGSNPVYVDQGDRYIDASASAADVEDGDITASIITIGASINTATPGTYTVTYTVSDAAGNADDATRTVHVVGQGGTPTPTPTPTSPTSPTPSTPPPAFSPTPPTSTPTPTPQPGSLPNPTPTPGSGGGPFAPPPPPPPGSPTPGSPTAGPAKVTPSPTGANESPSLVASILNVLDVPRKATEGALDRGISWSNKHITDTRAAYQKATRPSTATTTRATKGKIAATAAQGTFASIVKGALSLLRYVVSRPLLLYPPVSAAILFSIFKIYVFFSLSTMTALRSSNEPRDTFS